MPVARVNNNLQGSPECAWEEDSRGFEDQWVWSWRSFWLLLCECFIWELQPVILYKLGDWCGHLSRA